MLKKIIKFFKFAIKEFKQFDKALEAWNKRHHDRYSWDDNFKNIKDLVEAEKESDKLFSIISERTKPFRDNPKIICVSSIGEPTQFHITDPAIIAKIRKTFPQRDTDQIKYDFNNPVWEQFKNTQLGEPWQSPLSKIAETRVAKVNAHCPNCKTGYMRAFDHTTSYYKVPTGFVRPRLYINSQIAEIQYKILLESDPTIKYCYEHILKRLIAKQGVRGEKI